MRFEDVWNANEKATFEVASAAIAARKASPALSSGEQHLLGVPDALADDLLLLTRKKGDQTVLAAWHNGKTRRTFSIPLQKLGLSAADQPLTPTLFAGQDAKLSVRGGYLHLSLPAKDAAAFALAK